MPDDATTVDPSLPLFDESAALERVGDDRELLGDLLGIFLEECPAQISALEAAVNASDAGALTRAAHAVKGGLLSIGAEAPAAHARALEALGRSGTTEGAAAGLSTLQALMTELVQVLLAWRAAMAA
ncbi:MAG: Hpt domain-containing protein [Deltaproteobacteria bacterium]|nr:Hpt domain-containing protein [Deltaproteobacteria bacterium]